MDPTPRPPSRGPARLVAGIAIALAALVLLAWGALAVLFPPARVRALVSAQLSKSLAREVRFERAGLGLWPPVRLTVGGLAIAEPGGFERGAALQARSLHLDLALLPLLARRVEVTRLVLDRPVVHLVLRADGTTNFDGMMKPAPAKPAAGAAMDFSVRELRVASASLLVDDLKASRRVALELDTRTALASRQGGKRFDTSGETAIRDLAFGPLSAVRRADLDASLAKLEWRVVHDGAYDAERERLALTKLALAFGRTEIAMSGVVDEPGPRARVDLRAKASKVDLGELLRFVSAADARAVAGIRGSGTLDLDLAVRGAVRAAAPGGPPTAALTTLALEGAAAVRDAAFRYDGAPAGVEDLAFTVRFERDAIRIPDLAGRAGGQPVRATFALTRFANPVVQFTLDGDLDLAAVGPMVAPKDTKLGGRAAVRVGGRGPLSDPAGMALEGRARLSGVSVQSPALPKRIEQVEGAIEFSPARATMSDLTLRAGGSSLAMDATVTRPLALLAKPGATAPAGVRFTMTSPNLDLAELLPTTPGAPLAPNATGGGRVAIGRLRQQKLDVANVKADVALEPGIVSVPAYTLDAYGGAVAGAARFDLRDPARPAYTLKTRVQGVQADDLLSAWTPARGVLKGVLNTTFDLAGAGLEPDDLKRSLTAIGAAAIAEGSLGPARALEEIASLVKIPSFAQVRIKDGSMPFRVEHGRVVTDPVVLDGPSGEWRLSGAIGFDGALDYAVSTTLPAALAAGLGGGAALAAGALSDPQGRVLIDLRVTGSVKAPRVAWDSRAMHDRLAGRASQALADQREKIEQQFEAEAAARRKAVEDSVRAELGRMRRAAEDSLRRRAGDVLKGFFGGGTPDTAR